MNLINQNVPNLDKTPFWKCICSTFVEILIALIISTVIFAIWLIIGLPNFNYLSIIIFVLISALLTNIVKKQCGKTVGDMICRINPSESMRQKAYFWTYGIIVAICILVTVFSPTSSVNNMIENDTYELSIPNGWQAQLVTDQNPVLECIAVGIDPQNCAYLFTVNYNTTGVSLDDMTAMILGGFSRASASDVKTEDTKFQGIIAKRITSVLQNAPVEIIAFYAPNGKFGYIMSQNLSAEDRAKILSNIRLKSTPTPYADFNAVWKNFYGDNLECNINQPIDDVITLEGWKYDPTNSDVTMKIIINASTDNISDYFNNPDAKNEFIEGIAAGQIMGKLAQNYNMSVSIVIKDNFGNEVMTLPMF